jgi:hypothetical protein
VERDDHPLDLLLADQLLELVDLHVAAAAAVPLAEPDRADELEVMTGLELQPAGEALGDPPGSDDQAPLRGHDAAPQPARADAQAEGGGEGGGSHHQPLGRRNRDVGQHGHEQGGPDRAQRDPVEEVGGLVDRELPDPDVVAVVEAAQLCQQQPDRRGGGDPERRRALPREADRRGGDQDRAGVRGGQQAPPQGVLPEAPALGEAGRLPARHGGRAGLKTALASRRHDLPNTRRPWADLCPAVREARV